MTRQQERMYLLERGWTYSGADGDERWYLGMELQTCSFYEALERQRSSDARKRERAAQ